MRQLHTAALQRGFVAADCLFSLLQLFRKLLLKLLLDSVGCFVQGQLISHMGSQIIIIINLGPGTVRAHGVHEVVIVHLQTEHPGIEQQSRTFLLKGSQILLVVLREVFTLVIRVSILFKNACIVCLDIFMLYVRINIVNAESKIRSNFRCIATQNLICILPKRVTNF